MPNLFNRDSILSVSLTASQVSYHQALSNGQTNYFDWIKQLRDYEAGASNNVMTTSIENIVSPNGENFEYRVNVCKPPIEAEVDRLNVAGFDINLDIDKSPDANEPSASELMEQWLERLLRKNNQDQMQHDLHYAAARDGVAYLVYGYNADLNRPTCYVHEQFDGDIGVDAIYSQGEMVLAYKIWDELDVAPDFDRLRRCNIYTKNRVYMLYADIGETQREVDSSSLTWLPYTDSDDMPMEMVELGGSKYEAGTVYWTADGTEDGTPLGIPVVAFRHGRGDYGTSVLDDVVPALQDNVNRAALSLQLAQMFGAAKVKVVMGWAPPENATSQASWTGTPGTVYWLDVGQDEPVPQIGEWGADDLNQFIASKNNALIDVAVATRTPLPMLNPTGQIQAEGTLQQQEAQLLFKIKRLQVQYGNAWENLVQGLMKMDAAYNSTSELNSLFGLSQSIESTDALMMAINDMDISCIWHDAASRSESQEWSIIAQQQAVGIPLSVSLQQRGYTAQQIEQIPTAHSPLPPSAVASVASALDVVQSPSARAKLWQLLGMTRQEAAEIENAEIAQTQEVIARFETALERIMTGEQAANDTGTTTGATDPTNGQSTL